MKIQQLFVGMLLAAGVSLASATTVATKTIDYGQFSLTYESTSILLDPSFSTSGSDNVFGFGWSLPAVIQAISVGGAAADNTFFLPTFTVFANPGWSLSGPLSSFLGNVVFNEVDSVGSLAQTSMSATADVAVNGFPVGTAGGNVEKTTTTTVGGVRSGYYGDSAFSNFGSFNSLTVSNVTLRLQASGGAFASIIAQPQNVLEFSVTAIAAPVPEPES